MKITNYIREAFIRAALDDVPYVDYEEKIRAMTMKLAIAHLPPAVQTLYKKHPEYVKMRFIRVDGLGIYIPGLDDVSSLDLDSNPEINKLIAERAAQSVVRNNLKTKLRSCAYGCTTRKALVAMLPEFEKYLPKEQQTVRSLPVVANVVADFVKAGWPKGAKA